MFDRMKPRLPKRVVWALKGLAAATAFWLDYLRFLRFHGESQTGDRGADRAYLMLSCHILEKGLSLKAPRPGFGVEVRGRVLTLLENYIERWGHDEAACGARTILEAYCRFNEERGDSCPEIRSRLRAICEPAMFARDGETGGTLDLSRRGVQRAARGDFHELVMSRHSVRHFADGGVDDAVIRRAVEMATRSPSACNRQAWRVYAFSQATIKKAILDIQNGSRGFGEQAATLLVVTSDHRRFFGLHERHQPWVDGSLFAMSLMYALHYLGLGACPLHCCFKPRQETAFRRATGIAEYEPLILMIAVGNLPESFRVAKSTRLPIGEVLVPVCPRRTPDAANACDAEPRLKKVVTNGELELGEPVEDAAAAT